MRSEAIILFLKQPDFFFGILERKEPIDVQTLVAKAAVEGFDEWIVRWFSRPREVQRHLVIISPLVQRLRDEFAPVVALDSLRYHAAQRFDPFHHRHYVDAFQILAPRSPDTRDYNYRLKLRPEVSAHQTAHREQHII